MLVLIKHKGERAKDIFQTDLFVNLTIYLSLKVRKFIFYSNYITPLDTMA